MCGIPHERQLIILHALKREEFRANNTTALLLVLVTSLNGTKHLESDTSEKAVMSCNSQFISIPLTISGV